MLIFTERELKAHIGVDEPVIKAIEAAFSSLQTKEVDMPPIMRVDIPENNGEVDVKSAYIPGYDAFCIKMSSGFFDNHKRGLAERQRDDGIDQHRDGNSEIRTAG